jgi:prophage regulatory protein
MRLLDYEALKSKGVNFSRVHIWRLIKEGRFPKPIKLGGGSRNAWVESEIDDFIAAKMAERTAGAA